VVYPGVDRLTGTVTVADLLGLTAIDRITVVGQPSTHAQGPDPATPVLTRDHVRPDWQDGQLTLAVLPAAGGVLAPFEVPDPTPCCADHASRPSPAGHSAGDSSAADHVRLRTDRVPSPS
jgi:hypothetical protein